MYQSSYTNFLSFSFTEPKSLPGSCSKATISVINSMEIKGEVFHHWFAVAMCELWTNLKKSSSGSDLESFTFMNENLTPKKSCLQALINAWGKISGDEMAQTAYLSCLLDRFLFGNSPESGLCLHQVTLPRKTNRAIPDFCVVPGLPKCDPAEFVAISDYKNVEYEKAVIESAAYSIAGKECITTVERKNLRLYWPCSTEKVGLYLHVPVSDKFLSICVIEEAAPDSTFFCVLYAGVRYLLNNPIQSDNKVQPTSNLTLPLRKSQFQNGEVGRIFNNENKIYKFFDNNIEHFKPNLDLVQKVFPEATIQGLQPGERYCYLSYDYRAGSHMPSNAEHKHQQFSMLCKQLSAIHDSNFVHSDIRTENLVFSDSSEEAWIIDYDLADYEDVPYPHGFNHLDIPDRHPKALPNKPRKKEHDVYSLDKIATHHSIPSFYTKYKKGKTLENIAAEIEQCTSS